MHLFHIPQCNIQNRNVHISVLDVALWDMEQVHSGICEWGQFKLHLLAATFYAHWEAPVWEIMLYNLARMCLHKLGKMGMQWDNETMYKGLPSSVCVSIVVCSICIAFRIYRYRIYCLGVYNTYCYIKFYWSECRIYFLCVYNTYCYI